MMLYVIETVDDQSGLFDVLTDNFGSQGDDSIWIDGMRNNNDRKWYYYSQGEPSKAFTGLAWVSSATTSINKDCLLATNVAYSGSFKIDGGICSAYKNFVCEFTGY